MKDEPPPVPQDNSVQPPAAPVANMGNIGQSNMGPTNLGPPDMGHNLGQANMGQPNIGQANMGQSSLSQASMGQMNQSHIDAMSNIDPSIGIHQLSNIGPMSNMGNMPAPPGRAMNIQGGRARGDRIDEMPQEL